MLFLAPYFINSVNVVDSIFVLIHLNGLRQYKWYKLENFNQDSYKSVKRLFPDNF